MAPAASSEPDGDKALAKEWANKAKERFDAGDYQGAIDAMHEAQKHARPPTFTRFLAQANDKLGNLLEAQRLYQSIVDLKLDAAAPASWIATQEEAKKDIATLGPRIPTVRITVLGAAVAGLKVTVDGAPFDLAKLGSLVQQNPGKHVVVVEVAGRVERREVTLKERDAQEVTVNMTIEPAAPTATVAPVVTAAPAVSSVAVAVGTTAPPATVAATASTVAPAESGAPARVQRWPSLQAFLAWDVGLVGLVLGGVLGGLTISRREAYNKGGRTNYQFAEEGSTFSAGSDIAFALGGISIIAGTVLWIRGPEPTPPKGAKSARNVSLSIRPGGLTVGGQF